MNDSWLDSVVLIRSSDPTKKNDFGTGFPIFWDGRAAYFATCAHVVKDIGDPDKIVITYMPARGSNRVHSKIDVRAELYASGEADGIDLAILRVEGLQTLSVLHLRSTPNEKDKPFETAGFGRFDTHSFDFSTLQGVFGKQKQVGIEKYATVWDLIPNDGERLRSGNSGSPVIDEGGYVVAVVVTAQSEGKKGTATSIEALKAIWPNMPPDLFLPWQVDNYRVGAVLKRGEESVVCEGWYRNGMEEERVAIKFLPMHRLTDVLQRYFEPNARRFQNLLSGKANIVSLKAFGVAQGYVYLVMEYASNGSLADLVNKDQQISFDVALDYLLQTAEALSYAHANQITHGNVKLSNILLGSKGVLLSDFGILTGTHARGHTETFPYHTLPQRAREASDQYGLAMIACCLLTGDPSPQSGLRKLSATHREIAFVLTRALTPTQHYPSMVFFKRSLEHANLYGETRWPNRFVPPRPEQVSWSAETRPLPSVLPTLEAGPLPILTSPLAKRPRPLWRPLLVISVIVVLLLAGFGGVLLLSLRPATPTTTFCIATDFATTLGKDSDQVPFRNGADLAMQPLQNQNLDLGSGYSLLDQCADTSDDNAQGVRDPAVGEQNLQAFINNLQVIGMVGPASSDIVLKDLPDASSHDFPIVSPNTTNPCLTQLGTCRTSVNLQGAPSSYTRICATDTQQGQVDADFLTSTLQVHTAFLVDDGTVYGQGLASAFQDRLTYVDGGKVLGNAHLSGSTTPEQLAQEITSLNPQPQSVFFGGSTQEKGIGSLKKQLVQHGFTGILMGGDGVALSSQYLMDAGTAAINTYATALELPIPHSSSPSSFYQRYQHTYGPGVPDSVISLAAGGYDAAMVLIQAIKQVIKTDPAVFLSNDMKAIRGAVLEAVQSTRGYPGLTGTITIHDGDNAAITVLPVYEITSKQPQQWTPYSPGGS